MDQILIVKRVISQGLWRSQQFINRFTATTVAKE